LLWEIEKENFGFPVQYAPTIAVDKITKISGKYKNIFDGLTCNLT
jgi:hypothetical protein